MNAADGCGPVDRDVGRDLATELRKARADMIGTADERHYQTCHEAAAELDRLRADNLRLRRKVNAMWDAMGEHTSRAAVRRIVKAVREATPGSG